MDKDKIEITRDDWQMPAVMRVSISTVIKAIGIKPDSVIDLINNASAYVKQTAIYCREQVETTRKKIDVVENDQKKILSLNRFIAATLIKKENPDLIYNDETLQTILEQIENAEK